MNIHISDATATGTITFNADGTESQTTTIVASESTTYPTSCFSTAADCDNAATATAAQQNVTDAKCSFSSAGCACTAKVTTSDAANGTYQISGTSVIVQIPGETPATDPYCVSGNQLTLQTGNDGSGAPIATVTATR